MNYNEIIKNIIISKNSIITFIIDMENSSKEELEVLRLFIKDINKKVKVTLNNDNKLTYYKKPYDNKPYYFNPYSYGSFNSYFIDNDTLKLKNINSTNILIFKNNYFSTQIKNRSTFIFLIKNNEVTIIKNRYGTEDTKINIPIFLRKMKLRKMKKEDDNY